MEDRAVASEQAADRSNSSTRNTRLLNVENWQRRKNSKPPRWMRPASAGRENAWKQAEAYHQQRSSIAEQLGDETKLRAVNDDLWKVDNRRLRALDRQAEAERKLAKKAEARFHTAEEHNLILEEQRRTIEETLKVTTKDQKGDFRFKTPEEVRGGLGKAGELIANFEKDLRGLRR